MLIKQIMIGDPRIRSVRIGGLGEENATAVIFDCRKFIEWYGSDGTASVVVQRYGEDPYLPAQQTYDSSAGILTWTISGADTSVDSTGVAEVRFIIEDELVAKTPLYNLEIRKNIYASEEDAPEWYEDYLVSISQVAAEAAVSATAAAASADEAETYAEMAQVGADKTGWMFTSFDDETGIMTITVSEDLSEDVTITPDYTTGMMEVTIA